MVKEKNCYIFSFKICHYFTLEITVVKKTEIKCCFIFYFLQEGNSNFYVIVKEKTLLSFP